MVVGFYGDRDLTFNSSFLWVEHTDLLLVTTGIIALEILGNPGLVAFGVCKLVTDG